MAQSPNPVLEDLGRIYREFGKIRRAVIHIGIQGDESSEVLMIAAVHEYGCTIKVTDKMRAFLHHQGIHLKTGTGYINIPERSWLRASYDTGKPTIDKIVRAELDKVFVGKSTADQMMNVIGAQLVQMTQDFIREGSVKPPLSEYTLEHRTTSTTEPLFDTGTNIVERITYRIEQE